MHSDDAFFVDAKMRLPGSWLKELDGEFDTLCSVQAVVDWRTPEPCIACGASSHFYADGFEEIAVHPSCLINYSRKQIWTKLVLRAFEDSKFVITEEMRRAFGPKEVSRSSGMQWAKLGAYDPGHVIGS